MRFLKIVIMLTTVVYLTLGICNIQVDYYNHQCVEKCKQIYRGNPGAIEACIARCR